MIDAYTIGITLALNNGVADGIAAIRRDLATLDKAVDASIAGLVQLRAAAGASVAAASADVARLLETARRAASALPHLPLDRTAPEGAEPRPRAEPPAQAPSLPATALPAQSPAQVVSPAPIAATPAVSLENPASAHAAPPAARVPPTASMPTRAVPVLALPPPPARAAQASSPHEPAPTLPVVPHAAPPPPPRAPAARQSSDPPRHAPAALPAAPQPAPSKPSPAVAPASSQPERRSQAAPAIDYAAIARSLAPLPVPMPHQPEPSVLDGLEHTHTERRTEIREHEQETTIRTVIMPAEPAAPPVRHLPAPVAAGSVHDQLSRPLPATPPPSPESRPVASTPEPRAAHPAPVAPVSGAAAPEPARQFPLPRAASSGLPSAARQQSRPAPLPTSVEVVLDGTAIGRWMDQRLARAATRPPSGVTGFDPRLSPVWTTAPAS